MTENLKGAKLQGLVGPGVRRGSPEEGLLRRRAGWHHCTVLGSVPVQFTTL